LLITRSVENCLASGRPTPVAAQATAVPAAQQTGQFGPELQPRFRADEVDVQMWMHELSSDRSNIAHG
jgi:hypothetical protein